MIKMEDKNFEEEREPEQGTELTDTDDKTEAVEAPMPSYGVSYSPGENGYDCKRYGDSFTDPVNEAPEPKKSGKGKLAVRVLTAVSAIAVCAAVSIGGYIAFSSLLDYTPSPDTVPPVSTAADTEPDAPEQNDPETDLPLNGGTAIIYKNTEGYDYGDSRTDMINAIKDSVVEIRTEKTVSSIYYGNYTQSGAGSGVVLMREENDPTVYYIVTNHHVIDGADDIRVTLTDGSTYDAATVGTDAFSDIALLVIRVEEGRELRIAHCGDSEKLLLGQEIYAIGNPLGTLGGSVSGGIISCTERKIRVDGMGMTLLQIDAAVNPGNSGGALFDVYGNLVGVVNAKYSDEGIEGLGFAIPVNRAIEVVNELYVYGYVTGRASLALNLTDKSYSMNGATVTRPTLASDSSVMCRYTDKNGNEITFTLASGDIINAVSGVEVSSANYLFSLLSEYMIGNEVKLEVYRYEKTGTTTDWFGNERENYEYVKYTVTVTLTEYVLA